MKNLTIIFVILLSASCTKNNKQHNITKVTAHHSEVLQPTVTFPEINPPYQIKLDIDSTNNNQYNLIISIDIYDKDFLESPHSNGKFVNNLTISIDKTKNLSSKGSNLELPMPSEQPYSLEGKQPNLVKRSSVYTQKLTINSHDDFEIAGLLRFIVEPNYTMENVKFVISQQSGVLSIKKLQTSVCFGVFSHISCMHS
ncbi:hypothetical protein [Aquimarina sediminis]|uniref:hypothetical protein n=1 Tax=Aquimarina sediminis TaxID=2070536 RepID=UPI000CA04505|nr:hypothetical protein [Aquimarina sediminis]